MAQIKEIRETLYKVAFIPIVRTVELSDGIAVYRQNDDYAVGIELFGDSLVVTVSNMHDGSTIGRKYFTLSYYQKQELSRVLRAQEEIIRHAGVFSFPPSAVFLGAAD